MNFLGERSGAGTDVTDEKAGIFTMPEMDVGNNLFKALVNLASVSGTAPGDEARSILRQKADRLPEPFRNGLAQLVNRYAFAVLLKKKAFEEVVMDDLITIVPRHQYGEEGLMLESLDFAKEIAFLDGYPFLAEAARELALGVTEFRAFVEENALNEGIARREYLLDVDTPLGRLVVGGKGDNYYEDSVAFLVDLGGKDTYDARFGSSAAAPKSGVSLLLDLDGDDEYICEEDDAFGSGFFGVGLCYDCAGNDRYSAMGYSLGSAYVGVGILYDGAGDDRYGSGDFGQGSALFGYGLLVDAGGKDQYTGGRHTQGFGGTWGAGLLLDATGDDTYVAGGGAMGDVLNPEATACFAQGAARGYRKAPPEGAAPDECKLVSGGWGILADLSGDDTYTADSYAQGAGQWSGLGMLIDRYGKDSYTANRVAQGAGRFLASGLLFDVMGNDTYDVKAMGQGAASELSVGVLADYFGEDHYKAGDQSMGYVFSINCVGLLLDGADNDHYEAKSTCLGYAENVRAGGDGDVLRAVPGSRRRRRPLRGARRRHERRPLDLRGKQGRRGGPVK